jgi:hypothetical protein
MARDLSFSSLSTAPAFDHVHQRTQPSYIVFLEAGHLFIAKMQIAPRLREAFPHDLVNGLAFRFRRLKDLERHAVQGCEDRFVDFFFLRRRFSHFCLFPIRAASALCGRRRRPGLALKNLLLPARSAARSLCGLLFCRLPCMTLLPILIAHLVERRHTEIDLLRGVG